MREFIEDLEAIFYELWNELYKYICKLFDEEVNEDFFAPLPDYE